MRKDPKAVFEKWRELYFVSCRAGITEKIDEFDLTFIQRNAVTAISRNDGIPMTKLSNKLSLKGPAMTRVIDVLEKRGVVKRTRVAGDRRTYYLRLTRKGADVAKKLDRKPLEAFKKLLSEVTDSEYSHISRCMDNMIDRMSRVG